MYKEGRQYVLDAKAEVEGVVKDLKGIQRIRNLWYYKYKNLAEGAYFKYAKSNDMKQL